jgi:hypothetical protein
MTMKVISDLRSWFFSAVKDAPVSDMARVYVIDVMARPERVDMSTESIVLARAKAVTFVDHQRIGDWALWIGAFHPTHEHIQVTEAIGRMSYHSCYRLLGRRLRVYEELADQLPSIVNHLHVRLNETRSVE